MLIAFDFDGVLADSQAVVRPFVAQLAQERGLPPPDWEAMAHQRTWQILRRWRIRPWSLPRLMRRARAAVVDGWRALRPLPAGLTALRWALDGQRTVAVVSSNAQAAIEPFLAAHLGQAGQLVVVGDLPLFGKHRALRRLMRTGKGADGAGAYVGDEVRDVVSARRAGVAAIGVGWGKEPLAMLQAAGAWAVAADGPQLLAALARLAASVRGAGAACPSPVGQRRSAPARAPRPPG